MLLWDGPWVAGTEPNPPRYVNVQPSPKALEIRWDRALGPVQAYEVLVQPLDGSPVSVSKPVVNPVFYFEPYQPGTLYKVVVRTIGPGGARSFPSNDDYILTPSEQEIAREVMTRDSSTSNVVTGKVDVVGLQLSWPKPAGFAPAGYNLYRKSPGGRVEKVTAEPKHENRVWLTDVSGLQGWQWIVTAFKEGGGEKVIGTYTWYPGPAEMDSILEKPTLRLNASPQPNRELYLDWDKDPQAAGYILLFARNDDNVYELYRELNKAKPDVLLQIGGTHKRYHFIVVPRDARGKWLKKSKEAVAEFVALK
jgi:hypothetical protein